MRALLEWYSAIGVDIALDEKAQDRYAESASYIRLKAEQPAPPRPEASAVSASQRAKAQSPAAQPRVSAPLFPEEAARAAEDAASAASDLDEFATRFAAFDGCPFKSMASHFLLNAGTPGSRLMVLDFAPGEDEERSGREFSGATSVLLDNMLAAIGLTRETSYLAYFSPWRPPGDKSASAVEEAALLPFARRHIELARPELLLIFGEPTARAMLRTNLSGLRLQGVWFDYACARAPIQAMALPNLTSVLKTPSMKSGIWRHLRKVAAALA